MDNLYKPSGVDLTVTALRTVYAREGLQAAMQVAEQMINSAASIYAVECGRENARRMLRQIAQVLPDKRPPVH
jgi:hypothetical protein